MGSWPVPKAASNSVCEKQGPDEESVDSSLRLGVARESCSQWFLDQIYIGVGKYHGPRLLECLLSQTIHFSTGPPFHADTCMMSHASFMWQRRKHANMSQFTTVKNLRMLCCEYFRVFLLLLLLILIVKFLFFDVHFLSFSINFPLHFMSFFKMFICRLNSTIDMYYIWERFKQNHLGSGRD